MQMIFMAGLLSCGGFDEEGFYGRGADSCEGKRWRHDLQVDIIVLIDSSDARGVDYKCNA